MPVDPANPGAYMEKVRIMYDLARLPSRPTPPRDHAHARQRGDAGRRGIETPITEGYHNLSHHGNRRKNSRS
jgi:hypothetical protein